ncbi:conserved Plasmodium protein, unknown function, partial [Plasmodium ovale curtisi]
MTRNLKKAEKKARLNEKKDIDILANVFSGNKYGSKELIIDTDDEEKSVKILENKIMVLEKIIIKNQIKYNYFEEYLKTPIINENNYNNYMDEINKELKSIENMHTYIDNYN